MQEIRHILVPVDFNQHSDSLAEYALYMAKKLDADVIFIHVVRPLLDYSDYELDTLKTMVNVFHDHAEKKMAAFLAKIQRDGQDCSGLVLRGEVADSIIAYAKEKTVDLIIISTHGAQGIGKVLLGSVADRVVKGAHCPTLVFNPFKGTSGYEVCSPMNTCIQPV